MNGPIETGPIQAELIGWMLDRHGPALALYASQWTDAADDCVQEALVELARQVVVPENVRAWLYRAVKHRAMNAARGDRRRREREQHAAQRRPTFNRAAAIDSLDALVVSEALESLEPGEREVIVMRIWGGLTLSEIAAALESSTSSVHRQYQRALEQLRQKMEPPCTTNTKRANTRSPPS